MKKISSLFARDPSNPRVLTRDYHELASWVVAGEGVATRKWDGTAVLVKDGMLFARFDAKRGKPKPPGFVPAQDPDPHTGHHPGWVPAGRPEDRWIREAFDAATEKGVVLAMPWTYEACGPKIGGNPERLARHMLIPHGIHAVEGVPRDHDGLIAHFGVNDIEGIVWWRDPFDLDSPKIKITGDALGVKRPAGDAPGPSEAAEGK